MSGPGAHLMFIKTPSSAGDQTWSEKEKAFEKLEGFLLVLFYVLS